MFIYSFQSLCNHWIKNPLQLILLLIGLSTGTALWSGVQALNYVAKKSYDEATNIISNNKDKSIISEESMFIREELFSTFRKKGIPVRPILEGKSSDNIQIIGFDPISAIEKRSANSFIEDIEFNDFFSSTHSVITNSETKNKLINNKNIKKIFVSEKIPNNTIFVDISFAQILLKKKGYLSKFVIDKSFIIEDTILKKNNLKIDNSQSSLSLNSLTKSFHLNLTAFGFLSFLVGLFIVNATINLSLSQRIKTFKTLNAIGISKNYLIMLFISELILLSIIGSFLGMIAGHYFATLLLPDISSTISGLFGTKINDQIRVPISWWLIGIGLPILGTIIVSLTSLIEIKNIKLTKYNYSLDWASIAKKKMKIKIFLSTFIFFIIIFLYFNANNLILSFLFLGLSIVLFAILLPIFLWYFLTVLQKIFYKNSFVNWILSDSKKQINTISISLMALLIALSVNIGVGGMVGSFRITFHSWLDQRLISELYLQIQDENQKKEILKFLKKEADAVLPIVSNQYIISNEAIDIYGFLPHETYQKNWPLLKKEDKAWEKITDKQGIMINEQIFRKLNLKINDKIVLKNNNIEKELNIVAVYTDYGNPKGQMMIPLDLFFELFPNKNTNRFAIRIDKKYIPKFEEILNNKFKLPLQQMTNQDELKKLSKEIFEKTFKVSNALSSLTLIVAGIALFTSLTAISFFRLGEIAPIWVIGISLRSLALTEMTKSVLISMLTSLLAIPLGYLICNILTNFINVNAFGWKLPIYIFPKQWIYLFFISIFITLLAVSLPSFRLWKATPFSLLRKFNESF